MTAVAGHIRGGARKKKRGRRRLRGFSGKTEIALGIAFTAIAIVIALSTEGII